MSEVVTSTGTPRPYGIVVTSSGVRYILVKNNTQLEMWKNSGSGWSNVGTNQTVTTVHGTGATIIGYPGCAIGSDDVIHVADLPSNSNGTMDVTYATFDPASDSWSSWTEIGQFTGSPYQYNQWVNIVLDSNDKVWVGWGETDASANQRCLVSTNVTGSWATTEISAGYANERNLYIGADADDNIHAFWYDYTNIGWSYRKYTAGSGWGSQNPYGTGSRRYLYASNVVQFGTAVYALAATSGAVYYKDKDGYVNPAYINHDTTYDYVFQTVKDDRMFLLMSVISGSYNVLRLYEWDGDMLDPYFTAETITDNTANATYMCIAYDVLYKNYVGVELAYTRSNIVYYHQYAWATPASDSQSAFLQGPFAFTTDDQQAAYISGGLEVNDNQAAYLDCVPIRTSVEAWMNGYSTDVQRSSQSVYLFADMNENTRSYLEGKGLWPFSYDWSGDNNDSWDPMYWVTDDA